MPPRDLPSVDRLLRAPAVAALLETYRREPVVRLIREVLGGQRASMIGGVAAPDFDALVASITTEIENRWSLPFPAINATGVILHTNLGRAPLSDDAIEAMRAASAYIDLEYDLSTGKRGSRQQRVSAQLQALTGAEAAMATVNNAAALLLMLRVLCRGKDVIIARGEAVEIGGGVRIPHILRESGARLVEVGTTNRTRIDDYEGAITSRTGAVLRVHSSNFRIVGFTEAVPSAELAKLTRRHALPLLIDNGSGSLLDTAAFGLAHEPTPTDALEEGADLVCFSGDKLLGGPQSGLIAGSAPLVSRLAEHALARVVRPDKVTLAGLSATLLAYLRGDAVSTLPVWQMIAQTGEQLAGRAQRWSEMASSRGVGVSLLPGESTIGGGSLPGATLPTTLIALPGEITATRLRTCTPPVIGTTREGRTQLDLRTVSPSLEEVLLGSVEQAGGT